MGVAGVMTVLRRLKTGGKEETRVGRFIFPLRVPLACLVRLLS